VPVVFKRWFDLHSFLPLRFRSGVPFQPDKPNQRRLTGWAAHFLGWFKAIAAGRSVRLAENGAAVVGRQLGAADAGRLA
jgi:hypothetical protein